MDSFDKLNTVFKYLLGIFTAIILFMVLTNLDRDNDVSAEELLVREHETIQSEVKKEIYREYLSTDVDKLNGADFFYIYIGDYSYNVTEEIYDSVEEDKQYNVHHLKDFQGNVTILETENDFIFLLKGENPHDN